MKTITFYSYKGGVGRTLALANTAKRLSEFKKKVCILDFDLEAPGLHLKFPQLSQKKEHKPGIVDYIHEFVQNGIAPVSVKPYTSLIDFDNRYQSNINIITAGKIQESEYWKKLSSINWNDLFYNPESQGVPFFIDLKEKIKRDFDPDYLLIDSRTGVSEISGVTLSILADEIVIVSAYNEENLTGVSLILNSIVNPENFIFEKTPKIHLVLSRIPFANYKIKVPKEASLKESLKSYFSLEKIGIQPNEIIIIHSDPELEYKESLKIGYETEEKEEKRESIAFDYLELFKRLIYGDLSPVEINQFNKISEAENLYQKSVATREDKEKIEFITNAIALFPGASKFYFDRGAAYYREKKWPESTSDFRKCIGIDSSNSDAYTNLASCYLNTDDYAKAFEAVEEAIKLKPKYAFNYRLKGAIFSKQGISEDAIEWYLKAFELDPLNENVANGLADNYRKMGNIELAVKYVNLALELNPKYGASFSTLAEIKAVMNQKEEFYLFIAIALKLDNRIAEFFLKDSVYEPFLKEERFKQVCKRNGINLEELGNAKLKS